MTTYDLPSDVPEELLAGLNPEQRDAVRCLSGPLLIVAGPGSGKTRVLVHRIAALLHTGVFPSQVLAVTFTNKAAAELRDRVNTLVGASAADRMWISTFHSACARILRYEHAAAGLPRSFTIADSADSQRLVTSVMDTLGRLKDLNPSEKRSYVKDVHAIISRAKNNGHGPEHLAQSTVADQVDAAPVMAAYNELLAIRGVLDFDDLLLRARDVLRGDDATRQKYQQRFRHVLVDEYQDTNKVQYDIVHLLAGTADSVCVVGDADQSIYAFRGATPSVLTSFTDEHPNATVLALGQNYRSTARIVDVAQAVIDANTSPLRPQLRTDNETGEPVRLLAADSNFSEADWVVGEIQRRGGDPADHAVLVRTNSLTRALEQQLASCRIDYQVVGALRFYDRAEVKDALSYLRLAVNDGDVAAFERCVNTPKRGIGDATVKAVVDEALATGQTPAQVLAAVASGRARAGAHAFAAQLAAVRSAAGRGPAAALEAVGSAAGLREFLQALSAKEGVDREANFDELISYAEQFTRSGSATDPEARDIASLPGWEQTEAFLENVALVSSAETPTGQDAVHGGKVSLLTMHAAKGKEFPHVYVVGLEENICPHKRALDSGRASELEEERRLLYVAVSRAQLTLDLSYCRRRVTFKQEVQARPSRFLADLPADVAHVEDPASFAHRPPRAGDRRRSAMLPAAAAHPQRLTAAQLRAGDRVEHPMFGQGEVTLVATKTVSVNFGGLTRLLMLEAAPLTKLAS